jgi:hypothetical protein
MFETDQATSYSPLYLYLASAIVVLEVTCYVPLAGDLKPCLIYINRRLCIYSTVCRTQAKIERFEKQLASLAEIDHYLANNHFTGGGMSVQIDSHGRIFTLFVGLPVGSVGAGGRRWTGKTEESFVEMRSETQGARGESAAPLAARRDVSSCTAAPAASPAKQANLLCQKKKSRPTCAGRAEPLSLLLPFPPTPTYRARPFPLPSTGRFQIAP